MPYNCNSIPTGKVDELATIHIIDESTVAANDLYREFLVERN
jgi:hypothetical protein